MPFLAQALDPNQVQRQFDQTLLPDIAGRRSLRLQAIRVRRYKPERRCLFEYDVMVEYPHSRGANETLLGKARAKPVDRMNYQIVQSLWQSGFSDTSQDGISVPEPVGLIPEFHMSLQRKMPGVTTTQALAGVQGVPIARRIAEAAHKLHQAGIAVDRFHSISDEISILSERLEQAARLKPSLEPRLYRLMEACSSLANAMKAPQTTGIHRDFYADQVLLDESRLFILDLDLVCQGDPALDIGNFIGHITEYSLRVSGQAEALQDREQALEDRFVELTGESSRIRVRAYALLTLARHIYLSTQFPERQAFTQAILELCERWVAVPFAD